MKTPGFDILPEGKLLDQLLLLETPMGLAYERAIGFEKQSHQHHRHMMICPRGSCRMEVKDSKTKEVWKVDSTKILWMPQKSSHQDEGKSAIYDSLALFPSDEYFSDMIKDNGLSMRDQDYLEAHTILIKRTRWLNDILDRYFFERILNRHSPQGCTFFLEKQIINEVARIIFHEKLKQIWGEDEKDGGSTAPLDRAIQFIESNLFNNINLEQIVRASDISESTLTRQFRDKVGQTPYEYIKSRRLDEALHLIQKGEHPIGDIALLVGYEDFSSFSRAFKNRFKKAPSAFSS